MSKPLRLPTIAGSYLIKFPVGEKYREISYQGIINEVVDGYAYVTWFSWLDGEPLWNTIEPLNTLLAETAELHHDKERFLERIKKLTPAKGVQS